MDPRMNITRMEQGLLLAGAAVAIAVMAGCVVLAHLVDAAGRFRTRFL